MQEETTSTNSGEQQSPANIKNVYFEIGRELLAKPNMVCDYIESLAGTPTLVYCNTPSDTDFVEIMLKKRGVSALKLIGNVPQQKLENAEEQVRNKEVSVIVLTDIAARLINLDLFELAINYSIPADVDTYIDRSGASRNNKTIKKIVSLVTPLDLANFHYIKKGLNIEIETEEAPSSEVILKSRIDALSQAAAKEPTLSTDENIKTISELVKKDANFDSILAYLVHNTFNVIPSLKNSLAKNEANDFDDYDDAQPRDRGERQGRGGDRNDRRGGRDNRRGGGRDREDSRDNRSRSRDDSYSRNTRNDEDEDISGESSVRRSSSRRDSRSEDGDNRPRRNQRERDGNNSRNTPTKKDGRIYLGVGSEQNFSRDKFVEIIKDKLALSEADLKNFSLRKNCSFADLDDDKCDRIVTELNDQKLAGSDKLYVVKAITINTKSEVSDEQNDNSSSDSSLDYDSDSAQGQSFSEEEADGNIA